jgi:hypothetical protein
LRLKARQPYKNISVLGSTSDDGGILGAAPNIGDLE